jgi:hypothetical protein
MHFLRKTGETTLVTTRQMEPIYDLISMAAAAEQHSPVIMPTRQLLTLANWKDAFGRLHVSINMPEGSVSFFLTGHTYKSDVR